MLMRKASVILRAEIAARVADVFGFAQHVDLTAATHNVVARWISSLPCPDALREMELWGPVEGPAVIAAVADRFTKMRKLFVPEAVIAAKPLTRVVEANVATLDDLTTETFPRGDDPSDVERFFDAVKRTSGKLRELLYSCK